MLSASSREKLLSFQATESRSARRDRNFRLAIPSLIVNNHRPGFPSAQLLVRHGSHSSLNVLRPSFLELATSFLGASRLRQEKLLAFRKLFGAKVLSSYANVPIGSQGFRTIGSWAWACLSLSLRYFLLTTIW